MSKDQLNVMHNRASSGGQVARVTRYKISQNVPESSSITTEDKNIILKAYSTQKVGSGDNLEISLRQTLNTLNTNFSLH